MNKFFRYWTALAVALSSVAFTACGDDDDDDEDNNPSKEQTNPNNNPSNNPTDNNPSNGTEDNKPSAGIVGTWLFNPKESKTIVNGEVYDNGGDAEDDVFGTTITFKADGTFVSDDDMTGKYSLNGNELTIEFVEDGQTYVIKKGADVSEFMGDVPEEMEGMEDMVSTTVDEFSAVVSGDKLTLKMKTTLKMNLGDLGELGGLEDMGLGELGGLLGDYTVVTESTSVFNRK